MAEVGGGTSERQRGHHAGQIDAGAGFTAALQARGNGAAQFFEHCGIGLVGRAAANGEQPRCSKARWGDDFDDAADIAFKTRRDQRPPQLATTGGIGSGSGRAEQHVRADDDDLGMWGGIGGGSESNGDHLRTSFGQ